MKKPFCIRLDYIAQEKVKAFADRHGMKPTAAALFLLLNGIKTMEELTSSDERFDELEAKLKLMQQANFRALIYLTTQSPKDVVRFEAATQIAEKNVQEIFEHGKGGNHD